jgi:hypothetical protein
MTAHGLRTIGDRRQDLKRTAQLSTGYSQALPGFLVLMRILVTAIRIPFMICTNAG